MSAKAKTAIQILMDRAGLTAGDLAEKLNLSKSTVEGWAKGKKPYPALRSQLCSILGCPDEYLDNVPDESAPTVSVTEPEKKESDEPVTDSAVLPSEPVKEPEPETVPAPVKKARAKKTNPDKSDDKLAGEKTPEEPKVMLSALKAVPSVVAPEKKKKPASGKTKKNEPERIYDSAAQDALNKSVASLRQLADTLESVNATLSERQEAELNNSPLAARPILGKLVTEAQQLRDEDIEFIIQMVKRISKPLQ